MLNDHFDEVYCLNLSSRKDRMKTFEDRASRLQIKFKRFEAISGNLITEYYNLKDRNARPGNANYLACALSHLAIMENALNNGHKNILILEDDIVFRKDIHALSDKIFTSTTDWDLLYLGFIPLNDAMTWWDYLGIPENSVQNNIFKAKNLWCLYGYAISEKLMLDLLSTYKNNIEIEIDWYMVSKIQTSNNYKCYGALPQLVATYGGFSDNTKESEDLLSKSIDIRFANKEEYL